MAELWTRMIDNFMALSGAMKGVVIFISIWTIRAIFRR